MDNKEGIILYNYLISIYKDLLPILQKFYRQKPENLIVQREIINFLKAVFDMSNNSNKYLMITNGFHVFALECISNSYEEYISQNKDNVSFTKFVVELLKLLGNILTFGDTELTLKIKLKEYFEDNNIYDILKELNYSKCKEIQDLCQYIQKKFFEGYEDEEDED